MKITTKLGLLFAGMLVVFVLLGVTLLAQMRLVSDGYDAVLASPVRDIDAARVVQVNFKKEVQEWKDTLLSIFRLLLSRKSRAPSGRVGRVARRPAAARNPPSG